MNFIHGYWSYVDAVKALARHYNRSPDMITEDEIKAFFLHLINEKHASRSSITIHLCAMKFFFEKTLGKVFPVFDLIRPQSSTKLPIVLTLEEIKEILSHVRKPVPRAALLAIYSCGLRLSEGTSLQIQDIDSKRMVVMVRGGKGGKDRYVPLAQRTLEHLRAYWKIERSATWLFPSRKGDGPLSHGSLQKTFKAALKESGVKKKVSIHTLRHSYATHLLENGVDIRVIQEILGHASTSTTVIYTHITKKSVEALANTVNRIMSDL